MAAPDKVLKRLKTVNFAKVFHETKHDRMHTYSKLKKRKKFDSFIN